ncbi:Ig-like domain-containing protein [Algibacter lectus]|uniref:Ig-like domain-containing protein n=1 Tax=Algibacter lectus TaxID=221126 RepID=UPI0026F08BFB|nr:Ig-like domain-containing protein [Algibacter lectus]MDO7135814.1 Ig-like domain-containing protein [Algibacter lectus]
MLEISFLSKNISLLILAISLSLGSCSNDSKTEDPAEIIDYKPTANNDELTVEEDSTSGTANQVNVSINDNIGNDGGDGDDYNLETTASNGGVTEVSDGVFEYIPNADFNGDDSFTYTITDKDGDQDTATVNIIVNDVVDGPTAEDFNNIDPTQPSFTSIDNTTPDGKKWVKLESMSDEFEAWDSNKWFKSTWNYGIPVFMTSAATNSGVTDGNLWIKATLNESNPEDRWFQTARIHSKAETSFPMYTEARIKAAHISAYNTYWLNNGDINNRDEIDIIENNSKPSCVGCSQAADFPNQMNSQYFHADSSKSPVTIRDEDNFKRSGLSDTNPLKNVKWNEDYHTFGVWWKDAKHIQFYLNGEPAGSVEVGEDRSGTTYTDREFSRDLEIIFDLWTNEAVWVGGLPPKSDLADNTINTMKIDWVRTWKLEDE